MESWLLDEVKTFISGNELPIAFAIGAGLFSSFLTESDLWMTLGVVLGAAIGKFIQR